MQGIGFTQDVEVAKLRERLQRMDDAQLVEFGKAARYRCSPVANIGRPPLESFVIQLNEARAEWRRRRMNEGLNHQ
jgi:hypothetical protein